MAFGDILSPPARGFFDVLGHTFSIAVTIPEAELRLRVFLRGSLATPLHALCIVPRYAPAFAVTNSEIYLSIDLPLFSGFAMPLHRLCFVLLHACVTGVTPIPRAGCDLVVMLSA